MSSSPTWTPRLVTFKTVFGFLSILNHFLLQEHLPYADDSTAVTPKSELNGGIVVDTPTKMGLSRCNSFTLPASKSNSGQRKICSWEGECTMCNKMTSFQILGSNICSALGDFKYLLFVIFVISVQLWVICRKYSYNSHTGKESYTSHTDVR